MSAEVTLTLSNDLIERARIWANQSGRPLSEFLAETIETSLAPLAAAPLAPGDWTDDEVLAALDFQLPAADDRRLGQLLVGQREATLSAAEAAELQRLMARYQQSLLRRSAALVEAVRRGLRQAPAP